MPEHDPVGEAALLRRIAARDQTALSELYQQYGGLVYSLAMRVLQNHVQAEEVTQDTFLKVWSQPTSWDPAKGRLSSWLLTITRYTAIDLLRKERRRPSRSALALDDMLEIVGRREDDPALLDERVVRALLNQLPPEQVTVIELAFFAGMSHSEMAEQLQLPLGTVKTRVRLGLQKLKALWLDMGGG